MAKIITLKDKDNNTMYPQTTIYSVFDVDGQPVNEAITKLRINAIDIPRKNLFDLDASTLGYYIDSSGNFTEASAFSYSASIPVKSNTDYYLSESNGDAVGNVNSYGIYLLYGGTRTLFCTGNQQLHTPEDCIALVFSYVNNRTNIQLEEGTARTDYEKFIFPSIDTVPTPGSNNFVKSNGIYTDIVKQDFYSVKSGRKNLFNRSKSISGYYINSFGNRVVSSNFSLSESIPVSENTDYHLSALESNNTEIVVGTELSYGIYYCVNGESSVFSTGSTDLHTPVGCYALCFSYANARQSIQLEAGTSRTQYEPFIVNNFSDLFEKEYNDVSDPIDEYLYTEKSLNLVGNHNVINGVYINGSGELVANDNYKTYCAVIEERIEYQYLSTTPSRTTNIIVYKDAEGNLLSFASNISSSVSPTGARYLYISVSTDDINVQVSKGASPISYRSGDMYINPKLLYDYTSILPRLVYIIGGEQNSIYHRAYCRNYNDLNFYAEKYGGAWNYRKRCWRVEATDDATNKNLSFYLKDRRTGQSLIRYIRPTRVGKKTNITNSINISVIGDSFCYGGHYLKQMADCCGNANFVGMRKCQTYSIPCEGRGGWTLEAYFDPKSSDIALTHMQPFSPFMHAEGYNYYGVEEFWASIVNGTSRYSYGTAGFGDYASWFDESGRKKTPAVFDLMYNQTQGHYEYWSGAGWTQLENEPEFIFDYSKYSNIWQISAPDFVVIQLGTNDFYAGTEGISTWFQRMDIVIDSINTFADSVGKEIKILLCTPLTISGTPNNCYYDGVIKRDKYYYEARAQIIQKYDPSPVQVEKHVYVVDTGVVVDDEYGFLTEDQLPFAYYEGTARELYDVNGVHPNTGGYKQFGNPIAGAIQYLR